MQNVSVTMVEAMRNAPRKAVGSRRTKIRKAVFEGLFVASVIMIALVAFGGI